MTKIWILLSIFSISSFAGYIYQVPSYPTPFEAQKISARSQNNTIDLCCYYPSPEQLATLKMANLEKLIIRAGAFPSKEQLAILDKAPFTYELILSEVFPSKDDIRNLNNSKISQLRIISQDFPYLGEVHAFNQFTIPIRFDITKRELPTEEYMIVIREFRDTMEVGFHHTKVPGPGHAGFFNSFKGKKIFIVHEQFPYGIDAIGLKDYLRTKVEIAVDERLMSQDIPVLNQFTHPTQLQLLDLWPLNGQLIAKINQIEIDEIILLDDGYHTLLNEIFIGSFNISKSKVIFKFNNY